MALLWLENTKILPYIWLLWSLHKITQYYVLTSKGLWNLIYGIISFPGVMSCDKSVYSSILELCK